MPILNKHPPLDAAAVIALGLHISRIVSPRLYRRIALHPRHDCDPGPLPRAAPITSSAGAKAASTTRTAAEAASRATQVPYVANSAASSLTAAPTLTPSVSSPAGAGSSPGQSGRVLSIASQSEAAVRAGLSTAWHYHSNQEQDRSISGSFKDRAFNKRMAENSKLAARERAKIVEAMRITSRSKSHGTPSSVAGAMATKANSGSPSTASASSASAIQKSRKGMPAGTRTSLASQDSFLTALGTLSADDNSQGDGQR